MSDNSAAKPEVKKKEWLPYLIRGILGTVIALTLIPNFFAPQVRALS